MTRATKCVFSCFELSLDLLGRGFSNRLGQELHAMDRPAWSQYSIGFYFLPEVDSSACQNGISIGGGSLCKHDLVRDSIHAIIVHNTDVLRRWSRPRNASSFVSDCHWISPAGDSVTVIDKSCTSWIARRQSDVTWSTAR